MHKTHTYEDAHALCVCVCPVHARVHVRVVCVRVLCMRVCMCVLCVCVCPVHARVHVRVVCVCVRVCARARMRFGTCLLSTVRRTAPWKWLAPGQQICGAAPAGAGPVACTQQSTPLVGRAFARH